jgi:hypothetical protein
MVILLLLLLYYQLLLLLFLLLSLNISPPLPPQWRNLLPRLITKYHDGYIATALQAPTIVMQKIFYPLWWLKAAGYFEENKGNFGPGVILFGPGPGTAGEGGDGGFTAALLSAALLSSLLTMLLTVCYMQNRSKAQTQGYTTIECA